jgi:polysaccharide biosynthesis/export protein
MRPHTRLNVALGLLVLVAPLAGCGASSAKLSEFLMKPRRAVAGHEYRVLPPDTISIRSIHVPEINGVAQQIRPDGKVNLPLLGEVYVAGNTPKEIEDILTARASQYYEKVDATVTVAGYNSQKLYVFGQVSRPGPQAWTGTNTLLDVLSIAQPTTLAWPQKIRVVRGEAPRRGGYLPEEQRAAAKQAVAPGDKEAAESYERWAKGQEQLGSDAKVIIVNMNDMIKDGDMSRNILLQPDDVVYVRANPLAAIGLTVQQLLFPVRPAMEAARMPASVTGMAP